MTHVTCRLTAKNRDPLPNCTLGSRVWAAFFILRKNFFTILTFNFLFIYDNVERFVSGFFFGGGADITKAVDVLVRATLRQTALRTIQMPLSRI